jgi:hypothetical protein
VYDLLPEFETSVTPNACAAVGDAGIKADYSARLGANFEKTLHAGRARSDSSLRSRLATGLARAAGWAARCLLRARCRAPLGSDDGTTPRWLSLTAATLSASHERLLGLLEYLDFPDGEQTWSTTALQEILKSSDTVHVHSVRAGQGVADRARTPTC